jgi:hypothetical protein
MKHLSHSTKTFLLDDNWRDFQLDRDDFQPQSRGQNINFTAQFVKYWLNILSLFF